MYHSFLFIFLALSLLTSYASACYCDGLDAEAIARVAEHHKRIIPRDIVIRNVTRPAPKRTALLNVRVFDGHHLGDPSIVVIDGDKISFKVIDIDEEIDCCGKVLIPGLIEAHAHPSSIAELEILSSYGITTVMGMNCPDYALCNSLRDQVGLTSLISAGEAAVGPNSTHARVFQTPANETVSSPSQAPELVSSVFRNSSDFKKLISETNGFDQATANAIVAATHALGRKAQTHAADIASYNMAILSGTNGIQHMGIDGPLTQSMIAQMLAQNQTATPTLALLKALMAYPNNFLGVTVSNATYAIAAASVTALHAAGVPILAGTDSIGVSPTVAIPFGDSLHTELALLVDAGFSPAEALRAATHVSAHHYGLKDRGSIKEGRRADLVLLNADPLVDITASRDIARVWIAGVEYTALANNATTSAARKM
ncbi:hypothetical protein MMC13_004433 [Lambiella insularis]|nr:hypothetical protein [Lambiella insularis]